MQIDHIALWVDDLEKEMDFYRQYFAVKVSDKYENLQKQFASYFLSFTNGARIELMKRNDIEKKEKADDFGYAHFAINVGTRDKVDSLTKKLAEDGFTVAGFPRITGDGYYESVILDPEHNRVEITAIDNFKISEAQPEDLPQILYLQKCCYLSEAEIYDNYSIPPLRQTLPDLQNDFKNQTILKLEFANKIIGSVRAFTNLNTCYIGKLIIDKDYQNMGFGKKLMVEIENRFKDINRFELFTGFASTKNIYLYNKLGYHEFKHEQVNGMTIKYLEKCISQGDLQK